MIRQGNSTFLITITCIASVISMASFAVWPVFLTQLGDAWELSNTEVGWVNGAYFVGYVLATPVLVGLTDTVDAKRIFIGGALATCIGSAGFAMFAEGFWSASLTWGLVGAGLAGTYMPGLQILNARLDGEQRIKAVPFYTSCFGFGTGGSFYLNGHLLEYFDHHVAAWAGAVGSFLAAAAIALLVAGVTPERDPAGPARRHPLDLRPAFRKPQAMSYILAYFAHTFELFAYRGWSFALFAFLGASVSMSLSTITTLVSLLTVTGMAASIIGARYCLRYGRHRVISLVGMSSAVMALICAMLLEGPVWLALAFLWIYNIFIMLDSGALTAGTVAAADQHDRGALLAVHSMVGFTGGALGGPAVGLMLDIGGGADSMHSWFLALLVMGAGSALVGIIQAAFWWRQRQNDRLAGQSEL